MNTSAERFFRFVKGKTVAFIGIGTSNLPLIRLFAEKGAKVQALDKKDFESLGQNGALAKEYGAELILGESYLDSINADIVVLQTRACRGQRERQGADLRDGGVL